VGDVDSILEHGRQKFSEAGLIANSADRAWVGLAAELRAHAPGEIPPILPTQTEITLTMTGDGEGVVRRNGDGRLQETPVLPGMLWLCPAGVYEDRISISRPIDRVGHVYLAPGLFAELSLERSGPVAPQSVGYLAGLNDPLVEHIVRAILAELELETAGGRLLVETLARGLVAKLAHDYGTATDEARDVGRLDGRRLERVVAFIADEIEGDLSIARLADVACLSRFHFARAFKSATGQSPHRYVARQRFSHAKQLLLGSDRSLIDIALACGFSSHTSFSRAFARQSGLSPATYRRQRRQR
jgi:AraC family transcriptional regulator